MKGILERVFDYLNEVPQMSGPILDRLAKFCQEVTDFVAHSKGPHTMLMF